jgi:Zn-dependent peptidase ImmA (M78 family)/transcriptional regulator with XRE-family HTH domain
MVNMTRVAINPKLLRWARERARMDTLELEARFPKLGDWESREISPTLKQLEAYARATHVPVGYLFLPTPPEEPLPIPDFRTIAGRAVARPSPNLLDTIYACQERQAWYREFAQVSGQPALALVGSASTRTSPVDAAARLRAALAFDVDERRDCRTWTDALRLFIDQADTLGVLVMVSGVVLNNNRRRLDPEEFRGFALADDLAPLVFINGGDSKAAQMFTLAHELAHIWLRVSALSDAGPASTPDNATELWCNRVAAELLVPLDVFRAELIAGEPLAESLSRHARRFKVSTLVILRRLLDAGRLSRPAFFRAYEEEMARIAAITKGSGGDFYRTTVARVSRRFARALIESTLEGRTLYRDAFRMLGIAKTETFNEFGRSLDFNL